MSTVITQPTTVFESTQAPLPNGIDFLFPTGSPPFLTTPADLFWGRSKVHNHDATTTTSNRSISTSATDSSRKRTRSEIVDLTDSNHNDFHNTNNNNTVLGLIENKPTSKRPRLDHSQQQQQQRVDGRCTCVPGSPSRVDCSSCSMLQGTQHGSSALEQKKIDLAAEAAMLRLIEAEFQHNRALHFANAIYRAAEQTNRCTELIEMEPLKKESLVRMAKQLMQRQEEFTKLGKPTTVRLGYHYTSSGNMSSINDAGLMTRADQLSAGARSSKLSGNYFGDGIYCGCNPEAFQFFGDCGLLVAMLMGNVSARTRQRLNSKRSIAVSTDCVLGNKSSVVPFNECPPDTFLFKDEIVLKDSSQCLPLVKYDTKAFQWHNNCFQAGLWKFHEACQKIVDEYFNNSISTRVQRVNIQTDNEVISEYSRCTVGDSAIEETLVYDAPQTLEIKDIMSCCHRMRSANTSNQCSICSGPIIGKNKGAAVRVKECWHHFHADCLKTELDKDRRCPLCHIRVGEPQGRSPSGTMAIKVLQGMSCAGYELFDTIEIVYQIHDTMQSSFHENPGMRINGELLRTAYLPKTKNGYKLLQRLKYAFLHGLTFDVQGPSCPWSENDLIWSSIPHKTSMFVGNLWDSFPDPQYISTCNHVLDSLGVPKADKLLGATVAP